MDKLREDSALSPCTLNWLRKMLHNGVEPLWASDPHAIKGPRNSSAHGTFDNGSIDSPTTISLGGPSHFNSPVMNLLFWDCSFFGTTRGLQGFDSQGFQRFSGHRLWNGVLASLANSWRAPFATSSC